MQRFGMLMLGCVGLGIVLLAAAWLHAAPVQSACGPDGVCGMPVTPDCVVHEGDDRPADAQPCSPDSPSASEPVPGGLPVGHTSKPNPATGNWLVGTDDDPLAAFSRRPVDNFIIPEGGLFLDPLHDGPHYGIDYASPDDYLNGRPTYVYPIGPGYVTARSTCIPCYVDGDARGSVPEKLPRYNFGWGNLIIVETPYNHYVSIYVMYAHLGSDFVSLGQYITPEEPIATIGNSGYSEEMHLHMEVRIGPPGRFWNADFSQWPALDRWLATLFVNPALLVFPEYHANFAIDLDEWVAAQPQPPDLP